MMRTPWTIALCLIGLFIFGILNTSWVRAANVVNADYGRVLVCSCGKPVAKFVGGPSSWVAGTVPYNSSYPDMEEMRKACKSGASTYQGVMLWHAEKIANLSCPVGS